jgi:hypothetical protein
MRRLFTNLLLLLAGISLGLLVCEAGVRVLSGFIPKVAFLTSIGKDTPPYYADTLEEYIKIPAFLLNPHGRYIGCKTNSFGFNDEEFTEENTETIAVGDSFLFGRVPYPDNVISLLENELEKKCSLEKNFSIANFGIAGLQPRDYLEVVKLALKKYHPKTILLHIYLGNDFPQIANLDELIDELPKPENQFKKYISSHIELFTLYDNLKRVLFAEVKQPKIDESAKTDPTEEAGHCIPLNEDEQKYLNQPAFQSNDWFKIVNIEAGRFYPGKDSPEGLTKVRQQFIEPIAEIAKITRDKGIKLIAVLSPSQFPLRPDLRKWFFNKRALDGHPLQTEKFDLDLPSKTVAKILSDLGVQFIDISSFLRVKMENDAQTLYYAPGDTHWNENGNKAASEIMGNLLKPLLCNR